jgi:hypothetical protein
MQHFSDWDGEFGSAVDVKGNTFADGFCELIQIALLVVWLVVSDKGAELEISVCLNMPAYESSHVCIPTV